LHFAICNACIFLLFFHGLTDRDLWSSHEARAAMDAQSVLDGDVGLPHLFDGRAELQKPPLYYWLVAAVARVRGTEVDALAVRLPSALSAVGCVVLLVWFGRRIGRPGAGLVAAIILATAVHFTWLARIGRIDMPLTFAVTAACLAFYSYAPSLSTGSGGRARLLPSRGRDRLGRSLALPPRLGQNAARWSLCQLAGYLAVAAAVLLKGPIGAVLPAVVWYANRVLIRPRPSSLAPRPALRWGVPLVLVLTLPWFVWVTVTTHGEFFRVFVWYHNVERGLGGSTLRSHPWWTYPGYFAGDFMPWTPILVVAVVWFFRAGRWRTDAAARFGLIWFAAILVVLSFARFKRADYLLPAYPGAALFLGCVLTRLAEAWRFDLFRIVALRAAMIVLPLLAVGFWTVRVERDLPADEPFRDYRVFAATVRSHAPAPESVVFFRTEAHALAFHVGRPLAVVVEWDELESRLAAGEARFVVMPPEVADDWSQYLDGVRLEHVAGNTEVSGGRHERPLVLLRAVAE
jgi:4-amino-4-deoxy-L-arabinose transferase-like glycosyltransferase